MKRGFIALVVLVSLASCKGKSSKGNFEVTGRISNTPAFMIYLDEIPVASMQRMVVDSAKLGKDGHYTLKTDSKEASIYNIRVGQNGYPIAALVNDVSKITLDAVFSKENNQFAESYTVKGSQASQQLKDFSTGFTTKLQAVYFTNRRADSLQKGGASDTILTAVKSENATAIAELRNSTLDFINKSNNPALTMFELGYYQSAANNSQFKLEALSNDEVNKIIADVAAKFPEHLGVASIKATLDAQMNKLQGWVGQVAPELILPDVNGKEVKLSSFKGKYVLVDFWASWCGPCRHENPNVVKAYEKFKDKNFAILGVSLDRPGQKEQWQQAIRDDNLSWTQVSDLQYWDSPVVALYHIDGIPYNILVDPGGKIVAEALHGSSLERKLSELIK
jgi:thiol-disulfide isomerase/thioredoxin